MSEKLQRPGLCRRAGRVEGGHEPGSGESLLPAPSRPRTSEKFRSGTDVPGYYQLSLVGAAHFFVRKKENAFAQVFSHVNSHQGPGSSVKEKLRGADTLLC